MNLDFAGAQLNVVGEFIAAAPVPAGQSEFAPHFPTGRSVAGSIGFDTNQPDFDPDPNTGTYHAGSLTIDIAEIGLPVSRSTNSMQISCFNQINFDEFFAYVEDGVDRLSNNVGLPIPLSFDVNLYGSTGMLVDDQLPTATPNWISGDLTFVFRATDGTQRQVLMTFYPIPEPTTIGLAGLGLLSIAIARRRKR